MNKFENTWDQQFSAQKETPIDIVTSVNEDFIQKILDKHRNKDSDKYYQVIELPLYQDISGEMMYFKARINIGGTINEDGNPDHQQAKPFKIDFENQKPDKTFVSHTFKEGIDYNPSDLPPDVFPNLSLFCEQIGVQLEWPKQDSSGGNHKVDMNLFLNFSCKVDFVKEENRTSLKFIPTEVFIGPSDISPLNGQIEDLVIVLMNYIIKEQGPKFVREFEVPVFEMEQYSFVPSLIEIENDMLSVFLTRDPNNVSLIEEKVEALHTTFLNKADEDIKKNPDVLSLVFSDEISTKYRSTTDVEEKIEILEKANFKNFSEILPTAYQFLENLDSSKLSDQVNFSQISDQNIGFGIAEDLLDTILKESMPGSKEKSTKEKSALDLIKGRIRTWLKIFNSDIEIQTDGALEGKANIDIGAMLEYKLKEFYKCSTGWSNWKNIGLRVKGKPIVKIKVKNSNKGIGVFLDIEIKNVEVKTGLGKLMDALVTVLFKLFLFILEGLLKIISYALTFIIFPLKFEFEQQKTVIKLSNFSQWRYDRKDDYLRDNEKRYLSFLAKGSAQ